MRSIVKFGHSTAGILKIVIFWPNFLNMLRILDTNGFAQISKGFWVVQIEFCACVIRDNPRENGILRQIVESPSGNGIELHLR